MVMSTLIVIVIVIVIVINMGATPSYPRHIITISEVRIETRTGTKWDQVCKVNLIKHLNI